MANGGESGDGDGAASVEPRKRQEALQEYYYTQDAISRLDDISLKIKSWSVTSCGIALGFGISEQRPLLFGMAAFGALVFWYLEALWKVRQGIFIERSAQIEELLQDDRASYKGPRINDGFVNTTASPNARNGIWKLYNIGASVCRIS
jgi:hypothetical protein